MSKSIKLWYEEPAREWTEALPLGNGRIGAMAFSIPDRDVFMLNEDSLWSGYPRDGNVSDAHLHYPKAVELIMDEKYKEASDFIEDHLLGKYSEAYMPLGNLKLDFLDIDKDKVTNYKRSLSLNDALLRTEFEHEGIRYEREAFISYPDQSMVIRLRADKDNSINCKIYFDSPLKHEIGSENKSLYLDGICPSHSKPNYIQSDNPIVYEEDDTKKGISYRALAILDNRSGIISEDGGGLLLEGADELVIKLFTRTSFNGFDKHPHLEGKDYKANLDKDILKIKGLSYDELLLRHLDDYRKLYNRVELDLGPDKLNSIPTDKRLEDFQISQDDKGLYELIFQYGRYLMIAGSRRGSQPLNLQGIWNKELRPPWSSNYTLNINTEMNYWPAEKCNLSELHEPLFDLIDDLRVTGSRTAKIHYGARGFTAHHNTDLWRLSNPVGDLNRGTAGYAYWPLAAGWLCQHLYEHYEYSLDEEFLSDRAYPAIREAAIFFLDTLVKDDRGYYIMAPTTSPENAFIHGGESVKVSKTATMTIAIIKEVFSNLIKISDILGLEDDIIDEVRDKHNRLYPYELGSKGQLLEWEEEFDEPEPHHRHISHIYPLFPGYDINMLDTPKLAEGCRRSLELRGDDGTGWSLGWKINTWARLHDGDRALKLLKRQLNYVKSDDTNYSTGGGTYKNFFDAHPPFQIDGNFGATSGIAEIFLQSYDDRILILPALPREFKDGSVKGLRAKGDISTDISFKDGKLESLKIFTGSSKAVSIRLYYRDKSLAMTLEKGKIYEIDGSSFK